MESNNGYVKISRKLLDSNIWLDGYDAALFFYCLLNASHNRFGSLLPGQFYASITGIMKTLGWSRNCVRQHLHRLIHHHHDSVLATSSLFLSSLHCRNSSVRIGSCWFCRQWPLHNSWHRHHRGVAQCDSDRWYNTSYGTRCRNHSG